MIQKLIDKLNAHHRLEREEYRLLLGELTAEQELYIEKKAREVREAVYGKAVYIRGLIEFTNICGNDCYYCGIRASNREVRRYRLSEEDILHCTEAGYQLGFRTFVLQGGEDAYFEDKRLCRIVETIKENHPDCAVTLSLGERTRESYKRLKEAGADRYLLRHETANAAHYGYLHPERQTLEKRMKCLSDLRGLGYQVGCGGMIGSPGQTVDCLLDDLQFIEQFEPEMVGIGPFMPHHDTPFSAHPPGSLSLTRRMLSIIRLMKPDVLLPATTALSSIHPKGREMGILAGANVVMPNLSPQNVRGDYLLYDQKAYQGQEAAGSLAELKESMERIGYQVVVDRGDPPEQRGRQEEDGHRV